MGDSLKAIAMDEEDYEAICSRFGERSQGDPYGDHAKSLKDRARKEDEEKRKSLVLNSSEYRILLGLLFNQCVTLVESGNAYLMDKGVASWWDKVKKEYYDQKTEEYAKEKKRVLIERAKAKLTEEELTVLTEDLTKKQRHRTETKK